MTPKICPSINPKFRETIRTILLTAMLLPIFFFQEALAKEQSARTDVPNRPGVPPLNEKDCPPTHPIKGNFTTYSRERCIFHVEGQRYYLKTKPERCYATGAEAVLNGCRASKV